jgi:hypothetical protein
MALKIEIDSLDGLDEGVKALYTQKGDKFVLDVEGMDDIAGLKKKRDELLGETKAERAKRLELEKQLAEREEADAVKNKEFEKLAEMHKKAGTEAAEKLAALQKRVSDSAREAEALRIAGTLTKDAARAKLLVKEALSHIEHTDEGVSISGGRTAEQLAAELKTSFPFLADGNPASGGGASGGSGGGGATKRGDLGGTKADRTAAIKARFPDLT